MATVGAGGTFTLRLRTPDALSGQGGKYVAFQGVWFAFGLGRRGQLCTTTSRYKGGAGNAGHPEYLLRPVELEFIDCHQRMVERRIRAARFPAVHL